MTQTISFKASKTDQKLIMAIANRAVRLASKYGITYDLMTADMDITACHANGQPIDLERMLAADDFNFCHDAFGIRRHLNRETGQLEDCFVPRFATQGQHDWQYRQAKEAK